jgi:hypothetical protein
MKKTYVIAGNNHEFEAWCIEKRVAPSSPLVQYIPEFDGPKILSGIKNPEIICFGAYNRRRDFRELERLVREKSRPEVRIVYVQAPKLEKKLEVVSEYRKVFWRVV